MAGEGLDQLSGVLLGFKDAGEGLNYRELWQRLLVRKEPTCPLVAIGCVITADPFCEGTFMAHPFTHKAQQPAMQCVSHIAS